MARRKKPVDPALLEQSQAVAVDYAERAMPVETTPSGPETRGDSSPLTRSLTRNAGYVAPSVGVQAPEAEEAPSRRWQDYSGWDYVKDFWANETILTSALVRLRENGMEADPTYTLPVKDSPEWKQLTDGLEPDEWHVFGNAVSADHAREIAFRLREEKERQSRLMESGILPFLVGNVLNPESVLMAIGTGGLSWIQKGVRLQRAMKFAGVAASENVAQEGVLFKLQDSRNPMDMAFAAMAGIALGGGFGALSRGLPGDLKSKLGNTARSDAERVNVAQAEELKLIPPQPRKSAAGDIFDSENKLIDHDIHRALDAEEARLTKLEESLNTVTHTVDETGLHTVTSPNGKATAQENGSFLQMKRIDVAESARRNGEGFAMMERLLKEANARGLKGVSSDISVSQAQARVYANLKKSGNVVKQNPSAVNPDTGNLVSADPRAAVFEVTSPIGETRTNVLDLMRSARKTAKNVDERVNSLPKMLKDAMKARLSSARKDLNESLSPTSTSGSTAVAPGDAPLAFSKDSAGAASLADQFGVETSHFAQDVPETAATTGNRWWGLLPRLGDYASVLRGIKDPAIRARVGAYVGDPSPEKGLVSPIGASEVASRLHDRHMTAFAQVYEPAFKEHLEETGAGFMARVSRRHRREFGQLVVKELRSSTDTGSAAAKRAAQRLSRTFAEMGQELKDAGVKGFEDFVQEPRYFPRVPDRMKALLSRDTYGEPQLVDAVRFAIKKGYDDAGVPLDDKVLARMSAGYYKRIHDLSLGIQNDALVGLRLADAQQVAGLMRLGGASDEVIGETVARLRNALVDPEGGTSRFAKERTLLDEDFLMNIRNIESGAVDQKSLRDLLFHDDAEQVFQTYNRVMSGWTGLAKEAGIKSKADHVNLIDAVKREMGAKEGAHVAERLDDAFKFIVGQPLFDTKKFKIGRRIGRVLRDYQFARVMNMVGFAQVPDAAAYLTPHYFRFVARHLPDLNKMFKRMQDGSLEHQLARDLEEWVGGATDSLHNRLFSAFDDEPDLLLSKTEHAIRVAARVTERNPLGVGPATTVNQRLGEIAISQRFTDTVLGKSGSIPLNRWKQLGLDEEWLGRIKAQVEKHVEYDGGKLRALDFAKWEDTLARDKFIQAIHRESRRLVQEEDFGDTYPFMHSALGKLLIQFRRFGIVSYTKQLHYAVANKSWEQGAKLTTQMALGSLSYAAQMYLYSLSKPEDEREEWRAKYLTPTRIFLGGFARAGIFSLTPAFLDQGAQMLLGAEGMFSKSRTTGLGTGLLEGVPAIDFLTRSAEFVADVSQSIVRSDRQFDAKDYANMRKIFPWQNMIGIKQFLDYTQGLFPEGDEDDDTEAIDIVGGLTLRSKEE